MEKRSAKIQKERAIFNFCFLQRNESLKDKENEIRSLSELDMVITSCMKCINLRRK